ncbi:hypothetical protein BN1723_003220 [Verticillium longisporum]|uniref:GPI inositol-deacylase n=1 Tax=Verticillium longisporum TaxID=100787 RepID=A0A0G4LW60_VERLO|nr:hypothetical protein BN1723_003220 [Verticillium longisporum]CRK26278.1 hypothetical protein BN1708_014453 [Verticillium longisporum]
MYKLMRLRWNFLPTYLLCQEAFQAPTPFLPKQRTVGIPPNNRQHLSSDAVVGLCLQGHSAVRLTGPMKGRSSASSEDSVEPSRKALVVEDASFLNRPRSDFEHDAQPGPDASSRSNERHNTVTPLPISARRPASFNWKSDTPQPAGDSSNRTPSISTHQPPSLTSTSPDRPPGGKCAEAMRHDAASADGKHDASQQHEYRAALRSPFSVTLMAFMTAVLGITLLYAIVDSSWSRQVEEKGCRMSYMRPSYVRLHEFDTEHTRFATKYSLYLYREQGIDTNNKLRGAPVLFIPGNAGSYKQVRPVAAEAANYFHDALQQDPDTTARGVRPLDFFTVDFNEDITAFHGQTMLDQADYLNEAIRFILALYQDPRMTSRGVDLPEPTSVLILGHSMGGIVARTMLTMPNYQSNSINTIITMSAPHARAPVTFDSQIVSIYNDINSYWRQAYAQKWANDNPLWHVTLVSIAGGGLDTVVPSDYANIESLVPETNGFTVFTTGIPTVWTSMDHQAILWCDQFRKVLTRAIFDVIDARRPSQTKPRAERMRMFKKRFLTGMETSAEKVLSNNEPTTLLTVGDDVLASAAHGEQLVLRDLGGKPELEAHLLRIPSDRLSNGIQFNLLTNNPLDSPGEHGTLEVLFCSPAGHQSLQSPELVHLKLGPSNDRVDAVKLLCKNAAADQILLPASTDFTTQPFVSKTGQGHLPFIFLQYDMEDIAEYLYVAVIDKAVKPTSAFVVADFSSETQAKRIQTVGAGRLAALGLTMTLPGDRPMTAEVQFPNLKSSLVALHLEIHSPACSSKRLLFSPMIRQYLAHPHESRFYVNARRVDLSMHGAAPFLPPPLTPSSANDQGLSLQIWTDPTCESSLEIRLTVDILGSLGKLVIRYRTVFAAFPLLIVSLVLRKQFRVYDSTGVFISFSDSLDSCLKQSLPLVLLSLTLLSLSLRGSETSVTGILWDTWDANAPTTDFHSNDLLTGTRDSFFWFLVPLIGVVCIGVCVAIHLATVALTHILGLLYGYTMARPLWQRQDGRRRASTSAFVPSSPRRRMITTAVLLFLVSTFIPYQFAYLVACLVQLFTTVRALRITNEIGSTASHDFYNYAHSILLLMLWVLPINLPILAVWIRNLAIHWLTPFSSHHNVLSIMPFILLVENLTAGKMVPRLAGRTKHLTSIFLFSTAIYAAIYGISYAYMLHYLVNLVAVWLVVIHSTSDGWSLTGVNSLFDSRESFDAKGSKRP